MFEVLVNGNITEYILWDVSQVIGRVIVVEQKNNVKIKLINVINFRRGEGLGSMLLDRVVSDFGNRDIITTTFSSRVGWYERRGFVKMAEKNSIVEMFRKGSRGESAEVPVSSRASAIC